ncbi:hypothetical protein CNR34_00050 [Pseudomonas phage nickie]|uniref:Uncharacterized protein n=1 Tax=Pseudomonas phage nickie TaxID=2048977 RepID=A0A2H4P713_9CAUD|nr:hypothetical protein FDJ16_gp115 [Pseudomonas phage nickie]ATW57983.1 hypothetical protein CNR34_00050 [Pseudomonas phage nickie]
MDDAPKVEPTVVNNITNVDKRAFEVDWEQVTWIAGVLGVCGVIVAIALAIAQFNTHRNDKMAEAIKNGSHPMDAYCAFDGSSENKVCLVRAALTGKEVK